MEKLFMVKKGLVLHFLGPNIFIKLRNGSLSVKGGGRRGGGKLLGNKFC